HPRIGSADVVPIVPLRPADMERARSAALALARRIGEELELPVFLYGELGSGRGPAFFRRGGPDALQRRLDGGGLAPDFGPAGRGRARRRRLPARSCASTASTPRGCSSSGSWKSRS